MFIDENAQLAAKYGMTVKQFDKYIKDVGLRFNAAFEEADTLADAEFMQTIVEDEAKSAAIDAEWAKAIASDEEEQAAWLKTIEEADEREFYDDGA